MRTYLGEYDRAEATLKRRPYGTADSGNNADSNRIFSGRFSIFAGMAKVASPLRLRTIRRIGPHISVTIPAGAIVSANFAPIHFLSMFPPRPALAAKADAFR
jgi:hypothetical protein